MKPILVKFGVAFVFSLAGIFVVRLRKKGTKPSLPPPSPVFSDDGNEFELGARAQHKDEVLNLKSVPSSCSVVSVASQRYVSFVRLQFLFLTRQSFIAIEIGVSDTLQ